MATKAAAKTTTEPAAAAPTGRTKPTITSVVNIALPERKTARGSATVYPFNSLTEVGQMFGITDRDKKSVQSVVSNQNRKYKTPAKNDDGTVIMNGEKPRMTYTTHYEVIEVDAGIAEAIKDTPLAGSKVLVRRDI